MTWTSTGSTLASGANGVTTSSFDSRPTGSNKQAAYVAISSYVLGPDPTFVDSQSNSWTQIGTTLSQSVVQVKIFRCISFIPSATHTVTTSGTAIFHSVAFAVFETDEAGGIAVDGTFTSASEDNSNLNIKPGAKTPSRANTLLYSFAGHGGTGSQTLSVLTKLASADYTAGSFVGACHGWENAPASSQDPQFAWATNTVTNHIAFMDGIKSGQVFPWAINDIANLTIVPFDNGQTYATLTFTGTYNEAGTTPVTIEIQIEANPGGTVLQSYTALSSTSISGGNWSGTLQVPRGDQYQLKARAKDGGGSIIDTSSATTNIWGVGLIVAPVGQSHLPRMEDDTSSPPVANAGVRTMDADGTWHAPVGNGNIGLGNAFIAGTVGQGLGGTSIPIGITRTGIGGAGWGVDGGSLGTQYYTGGVWTDTSTVGQPFPLYKICLGNLIGTKDPNVLLFLGGSSDAIYPRTFNQIYTDMQTTRSNINTFHSLSSAQLPALICVNGRDAGSGGGDTDANWSNCVQTDLTFASVQTNASLAACLVDLPLVDNYHLTPGGYGILGQRIAQSLLKFLGLSSVDGGTLINSSGFRWNGSANLLLSINLNGATGIQTAGGGTSGTGLTGWEASDDAFSTNLTISSTKFVEPNTVVLTLSSAPADVDDIVVRYMYGKNPTVTTPTYDNTTPGGNTNGRTLAPTLGDISISADVLADRRSNGYRAGSRSSYY